MSRWLNLKDEHGPLAVREDNVLEVFTAKDGRVVIVTNSHHGFVALTNTWAEVMAELNGAPAPAPKPRTQAITLSVICSGMITIEIDRLRSVERLPAGGSEVKFYGLNSSIETIRVCEIPREIFALIYWADREP